jgi:O-antigen ligase
MPLPISAVVALLIAAIPLAQWALGAISFFSDALLPAAYLVGFAIAVIAGAQLTKTSPPFIGAVFACCAIGAIASVGIGLAQWLQLGPFGFIEYASRSDRMYANLTQPNQLASLIGLGLAAIWWSYETGRVRGPVAAMALLYLGFGLAMTQSRVGWIFVAMFACMWALYRKRLHLRTTAAAVAASIAVFAVFVLVRGPIDSWVHLDQASTALRVRISDPHRLTHYTALLEALLAKPWTGYGWMQIAAAQQAVTLNHPPTFELLSAAHNQALDFLIWNGIPLGLLIVGTIGWWAVNRMRRCPDTDVWALFCALGVLVMHSMLELPLQYAYFLLPAGLMVGIIEARTQPAARRWSISLPKAPYAAVAVAMTGLMYVIWDEYYEVEEAVRRVRLQNEVRMVLQSTPPTVPDVVLLDGQREYVRLWLTGPHDRMTDAQLDWYHRVVVRYPSPGALTRFAVAAALNGREAEARRALELMCHMAKPRHCDVGRVVWENAARRQPLIAAVAFPDTPVRR